MNVDNCLLSDSSDDEYDDKKKIINKEERLRRYHRKVKSKINDMLLHQDKAKKFIDKAKTIEDRYNIKISDAELLESYLKR